MCNNKDIQSRFEILQKQEHKTSCGTMVSEKPMVSVSIATYQHVNLIEECLNNILKQQTRFSFEIVIGEDDSNDGTREICLNYAQRFPNKIRLFLRDRKISCLYDNEGKLIKSLNGIATTLACRGKYTAMCEGDDYWTDPFKLQKQVDFLEANPDYAGCYHDTMVTYSKNIKRDHLFRDSLPQSMTAEDTIACLSPFHTSSFMFKSETYSFEPFLAKVKSGDMAHFSIIASKGLLGKVDGVMSVYRKHDGGITNSSSVKDRFHQDRIELIQYLNAFHEYKFDRKAKEVIQIHLQRQASGSKSRDKINIFFKWAIQLKKMIFNRIP